MKISRFKPAPELAPYIYEYLFVNIPGGLSMEKCLPDGFMKLFIYTGTNLPQYYDSKGRKKDWNDGFGGHAIDDSFYVQAAEQIEGIVCSFKPHGLFHLYNIPVQNFNNNILPIDVLMGQEGKLIKEQLQEAVHEREKIRILNHYFCRLLRRKGDVGISPIAEAQHLILANNGIINIEQLAGSLSITRRSLERNFMEQVGTTPKYFARILRFNYAIKQKYVHPNIRWHDIIYNCGYFDQSHFIKEFKHFFGVTPEVFYGKEHRMKEICVGSALQYEA